MCTMAEKKNVKLKSKSLGFSFRKKKKGPDEQVLMKLSLIYCIFFIKIKNSFLSKLQKVKKYIDQVVSIYIFVYPVEKISNDFHIFSQEK